MKLRSAIRVAITTVTGLALCLALVGANVSPAEAAVKPRVTKISTHTGPTAGGNKITLKGRGFAKVRKVLFGRTAAPAFTVVSRKKLVVTVPAGRVGTVHIRVVTARGKSKKTKGDKYRYVANPVTPRVDTPVAESDRLIAGQILLSGQYRVATNRAAKLVMQSDCNLVLYNSSNKATWATNTAGKGTGCYASMQTDGNLVVYTAANKAVWSSNTAGFKGAWLKVQTDGNLVIYRGQAIWSKDGPLYDRLNSGQSLTSGQSLISPNRAFTLIMQGDGNLVIYRSGQAQWASSTSGAGNWVVMQGDGNLVIYTAAGKPLWDSKTAGKPGAHLRMQDDGNLVVYQGGTAVWDRWRSIGDPRVDAFKTWALDSSHWNSTTPYGYRGIDADGAYGAQCADLGIAWSIQAGHRVGFDGWDTASASKPGWHVVSSSMAQALPGDVVTRVGGNQHVVVVTGAPANGVVQIIQQNPRSPALANYSTGTSGVVWRLNG